MINKKISEILVVDDQKELVDLIVEFLRTAGYTVHGACSAEEALRVLERAHIYLVLLDIQMPRVNGIELLKMIKKRQPLVQVVMMTGYGSIDRAVLTMKTGAYDFLSKPIDFKELDALILKALEDRKSIIEEKNLKGGLKRKLRNVTTELKRTKKKKSGEGGG
ncbi:MAG: response regulator [Candidatus Omnitrophica bacterium]|nr:response regulator [Candidatus Omnitrophota bacterium]